MRKGETTFPLFAWLGGVLLVLAMTFCPPDGAAAQDDLRQINQATEVRRIAFRGNETFTSDELRERIAIDAPGYVERLMRPITRRPPIAWVPFWRAREYPFSPLELQRDVARLRLFYRRNGFLHPDIDYIAQFDESQNRIRVYFVIDEGPPLLVREVEFRTPGGAPAYTQFEDDDEADRWVRFRDRVVLSEGERFTDLRLGQLSDQTLQWLRDRGHAFAEVRSSVEIDTLANDAFVAITVDAGPRAYFSEIQLEGLENVERNVVLRSLPFRPGDRFSNRRLADGQRQIFALNLFRAALSDIPDQPRSDSVIVRYRLREARPRYLSAQTGYVQDDGIVLRGSWQHRNFLGGGRDFTVSARWATGIMAVPIAGGDASRSYNFAVSLRQPYVFLPRMSAIVRPSFEQVHEPAYQIRQYQLSSELIYDFYRFRTVSLRHSIARAYSLTPGPIEEPGRFYNKNILGLSGTFGRADDYFNPSRGFLVRPFAEVAGPNIFRSDVQYLKLGSEQTGYMPLIRNVGIAGRFFAGRVWPYGISENQEHPIVRERFRETRFYAGGSSDVRGWRRQMLGPKEIVDRRRPGEDEPRLVFEPLGGLSKIAGNIEVRMPIPGFRREWGSVAFLDFGNVWEGNPRLDPGDMKYGTGVGIRYETPVGPLRFDVAYKLNPSPLDLRSPDDPEGEPETRRRFAFYFSIGPTF